MIIFLLMNNYLKYRFGHTMIPPTLFRLDQNLQPIQGEIIITIHELESQKEIKSRFSKTLG